MHHDGIRLGAGQACGGQAEQAVELAFARQQATGHALALQAQHDHHVHILEAFGHIGVDLHAVLLDTDGQQGFRCDHANIRAAQGLQGQLRHFLSLDGLRRELLTEILDTADSFLEVGARAVKKVPLLRGKTVCNVFFENSTRTRTTFEMAAQRLSADVITLNVSTSSASKGETLLDTLRNLEAMAADMFVVRHGDSGAAHFIAEHVCPQVAIINGGDGRHAHPTQGMLDMLTIRRHKGGFENLSVAIVGDILHSRVARSNMIALKTLGCPDIRVIAPKTLLPIGIEQYGVKVYTDMTEGLKDVDVVIMLRLQRERMSGGLLPSEGEFYRLFGLTTARLAGAKPDCIVMHPGPINRGVEIESAVADGPHSVILNQVTYGIAVRMAVLSMTMSGQTAQRQFEQENAQ